MEPDSSTHPQLAFWLLENFTCQWSVANAYLLTGSIYFFRFLFQLLVELISALWNGPVTNPEPNFTRGRQAVSHSHTVLKIWKCCHGSCLAITAKRDPQYYSAVPSGNEYVYGLPSAYKDHFFVRPVTVCRETSNFRWILGGLLWISGYMKLNQRQFWTRKSMAM